MKTRVLVILLAVSFLSGCYANMRFYPVSGPLATQTPLPVFTAKVSGVTNSGDISLVLADGESCQGTWHRVKAVQGPTGETMPNSATSEMASVWDSVYGQGFYVSRVLGIYYHGAAQVTGERGTVLNVEFIRGDDHEHGSGDRGRGVAKDNQGNIYKVVF